MLLLSEFRFPVPGRRLFVEHHISGRASVPWDILPRGGATAVLCAASPGCLCVGAFGTIGVFATIAVP